MDFTMFSTTQNNIV